MKDTLLATCGTTDALQLILRGGRVQRYHAEGEELLQSVAAHSWGVMCILLHLWPNASATLIKAALYHDVAEAYIGDIPAPIKRHPEMRAVFQQMENEFNQHLSLGFEEQLTSTERLQLKIADYLELCLHCRQRFHAQEARRVLGVGRGYVKEYASQLPVDDYDRINKLMKEHL